MSLTAKDVAEILRLLEDSTFDELTLEMDGVKLSLQRGASGAATERSAPARAPEPGPAPAPAAPPKRAAAKPPSDPSLVDVPSPLLGVFYRAPKPGEPPFVDVGSKVEADSVIGIIEVMKLMNTVRAGVAGEVADILGENGALVEYGETLMRVRPSA